MIRVKKVETDQELEQAFKIREEVFIVGQNCSVEDEFDGFDDESTHFIAYIDGEPVGTARYRTTDKGIKLERFAVLEKCRGKGVGKRLVKSSLSDLEHQKLPSGTVLYLHAQLAAMPLYARHGFQKEGEQFDEVSIAHFKMSKTV